MARDSQLSLFDDENENENENFPGAPAKEMNPDAPRTPAGKRVFVVDAYGLVYQVFHALPEMQGRKGESVNAVFGFMRDVFFLLEHLNPDFLFCAFDVHAPTFRHKAYAEYKIQREAMPEDLRMQIPRIKELLEVMRIPILQRAGFEADDILATVATQTAAEGGDCFLVTSDKDCRQLLAPHVQIYSLRRGKYLDEAFLLEDWGITPAQVVDFQSLVGDASDNIPGIAKIGPKSAREMIQRFGSVEEILKPENITAYFGEKPSVRKQNLLDGAETLRMSRELVTLRRDVPIPVNWHLGHVSQFDFLAARPIFRDYAFNSMAAKILKLNEMYGPEGACAEHPHGENAAASASTSGAKHAETRPLAETEDTMEDTRQDTAEDWPEIPAFSGRFSPKMLAGERPNVCILPPALFEEEKAPAHTHFAKMLEPFCVAAEDPAVVKVGYDLKRVWKTFRAHGVKLTGPLFDTMIAAYMLIPGEKGITLRELAEEFPEAAPQGGDGEWGTGDGENAELGMRNEEWGENAECEAQRGIFDDEQGDAEDGAGDEAENAGRKKTVKKTAKKGAKKETPPHPTTHAAYQMALLENLYPVLMRRLAENRLDAVCYAVEFPLIPVLAEMEYTGIYVDRTRLEKLHTRFAAKEGELREELMRLAFPESETDAEAGADAESGEETRAGTGTDVAGELSPQTLNLNSPIQLQKILFEKLGLPVIRKTKTGFSTDAQTLEELAAMNLHPFPEKLLEYRQVSKLMNTYVDALPELINPKTGRIHTTFNQAVTATGRLSSSEPNLQNIPVRMPEGREIRGAFMPHPAGWKFISADYSQIELRVLAHYCKDENLCAAFHRDEDIHTQVAAQIFSTTAEHVTPSMRRVAKSVNFGVIYGQSAFGLSKQLGIPQDEAQHFITTYFAKYPTIPGFLDGVLDDALKSGHVSTILGRHRRISGIRPHAARKGQLNLAERMAVNAVIQGSAADIIKLAMLAVDERLKAEKYAARLLLQIHDELLLECPAAETADITALVETEMSGVWHLDVPLKVSAMVEDDWGAKE